MLTSLYFSILTYKYSFCVPTALHLSRLTNQYEKKIVFLNWRPYSGFLLIDDAFFMITAVQFAFVTEPFSFKYAIKWLQKLNEDQKDL